MTTDADREIQGNLFTHPPAELIAELCAGGVSGSLRLDNKDRKCIVYFNGGRIVFAVSNARTARLFQVILDSGYLAESDLAKAPNVLNDMELAAYLEATGQLTKPQCSELFTQQVERIILDVVAWTDGNWAFSSLKRVREELEFKVDVQRLLLTHARSMSPEDTLSRFRSLGERFHVAEHLRPDLRLERAEAVVISHNSLAGITLTELVSLSGLPQIEALHAVYTLWLAGLVVREDFQRAISRDRLTGFKEARLAIKQEAKIAVPVLPEAVVAPKIPFPSADEQPAEISIEDYLSRVENASTYYEALGVDTKASLAEIKTAYLTIARTFHPDKYHSEDPELLKRVQNAFAAMMQANESLKSQESRDVYDYRMRKELAAIEDAKAQGKPVDVERSVDEAAENFEHGFSLLMDGEREKALPFLTRAVHYAPTVARYRAYYGQALASDPKQRHKAEAEMQAAVKQDPDNAAFRLLLAEFFVEVNLLKRAEGELNRLLAIFPDNREAQQLLATLKAKA